MKYVANISPASFAQVVAQHNGRWVIDTETDGLRVRGPRARNTAKYLGAFPLGKDTTFVWGPGCGGLAPILEVLAKQPLIGHNLRFDLHALGLVPERGWEDTMNMKYFTNTTGPKSLDDLVFRVGRKKVKTPALIKQGRIAEMPFDEVARYLADDCLVTGLVYEELAGNYARQAPDWDMALEPAVYAMERRGVRLLPEPFGEFRREVLQEEKEAERAVRGHGFRGLLSSPSQVADWLDSMGLMLPETDKGNLSSATPALEPLLDPRADAIVRWRKAYKLRTAFLDTLPGWAQGEIIYPGLKTSSTATGRLSCAEPNLQQVPKRGRLGKAFRKCFTGPSGSVTVADYSQMEMRVAAALSGDAALGEIFASGADLHDEVARRVGGVGRGDAVSPDLRVRAKALNFGILNGMKPKRLAQEMSKMTGYKRTYTLDEATEAYDAYLARFPDLADWMTATWAEARESRVVSTEAGRIRVYDYGESTLSAVSVRVQGTAAEMVRLAVIKAEEAGLEPILQVHDEIVCNRAGRCAILREVMEEAASAAFESTRDMSYKVDAEDGGTWG